MSGWYRIGVVFSVLWFGGFYLWAWNRFIGIDEDAKRHFLLDQCDKRIEGLAYLSQSQQEEYARCFNLAFAPIHQPTCSTESLP